MIRGVEKCERCGRLVFGAVDENGDEIILDKDFPTFETDDEEGEECATEVSWAFVPHGPICLFARKPSQADLRLLDWGKESRNG